MLTLDQLTAPQPGPPDPEHCDWCRVLRDTLHTRAAHGDINGVCTARDLRALHENRAHQGRPHERTPKADAVRAPKRQTS
ncbi:hypothetical protein ACFXAZ_33620 [Streptomyces sp. NPDC059477]|uniref:hypothetical protein n=1 Tax=Streptomyces sp. NPDC059477 TaxID=3346847 RepID=UPI0036859D81